MVRRARCPRPLPTTSTRSSTRCVSSRETPEPIGLLSFAEDFFVILRCVGDDVRMLLSDVTAAFDAPFAGQVLDRLGLPMPDGDDEDDIEPAGDLDLLADLGVSPLLLAELCDDLDLYPDDVFGQLAEHMGFSEQYDAAMQLVA